jgi:hypothetical protein
MSAKRADPEMSTVNLPAQVAAVLTRYARQARYALWDLDG